MGNFETSPQPENSDRSETKLEAIEQLLRDRRSIEILAKELGIQLPERKAI